MQHGKKEPWLLAVNFYDGCDMRGGYIGNKAHAWQAADVFASVPAMMPAIKLGALGTATGASWGGPDASTSAYPGI